MHLIISLYWNSLMYTKSAYWYILVLAYFQSSTCGSENIGNYFCFMVFNLLKQLSPPQKIRNNILWFWKVLGWVMCSVLRLHIYFNSRLIYVILLVIFSLCSEKQCKYFQLRFVQPQYNIFLSIFTNIEKRMLTSVLKMHVLCICAHLSFFFHTGNGFLFFFLPQTAMLIFLWVLLPLSKFSL